LTRIFKKLDLYNKDYHIKYRKALKEKRYQKYLGYLKVDMFTRLIDLRRELDIEKKMKKQFPEPDFEIFDVYGNKID